MPMSIYFLYTKPFGRFDSDGLIKDLLGLAPGFELGSGLLMFLFILLSTVAMQAGSFHHE